MNFIQHYLPTTGNVLTITNGTGSGHVEAHKHIVSEIQANLPNLNVVSADVFQILMGEELSKWMLDRLNSMYHHEQVGSLSGILDFQFLDVWLLTYIVFFRFIYYLVSSDINVVITTQPLSNKALLLAVRIVNFINKILYSKATPIRVYGVFTDLPTKEAAPFFYSYKSLSSADHEIFKLVSAPPPILENGETEEEFWEKNCNLSLENGEVIYDNYPIRKAFKDLDLEQPIHDLKILANSDEELNRIYHCCPQEAFAICKSEDKTHLNFKIDDQDEVGYLMLGGQTFVNSTLRYVEEFIKYGKAFKGDGHKRFYFVLCGKNKAEDSLFNQVCDLVQAAKKNIGYPKDDLIIVPVSYQNDVEIAPILARSNYPIFKPGGIACMEAKQVAKRGTILLHSSYKENPYIATQESLLSNGVIRWEKGNVKAMKKELGAILITPDTFLEYLVGRRRQIRINAENHVA